MIFENSVSTDLAEAVKVAMEDDWLTFAARGVYVWLLHCPNKAAKVGQLIDAQPNREGFASALAAAELLQECGYATFRRGVVSAILP